MASPGDVLVINNDGGTHVAPWGELATLSCMQKGLAGVVIDGAARDIDDIRTLGFPVFSTATVQMPGNPRDSERSMPRSPVADRLSGPVTGSSATRVGSSSSPKERAYEVARRALEVRKNEERVREEIRRGSTLSHVAALVKWEKKK